MKVKSYWLMPITQVRDVLSVEVYINRTVIKAFINIHAQTAVTRVMMTE